MFVLDPLMLIDNHDHGDCTPLFCQHRIGFPSFSQATGREQLCQMGKVHLCSSRLTIVAVIHLSPHTELCTCSCYFVSIAFHMLQCLLHNPSLGELATSVLSPKTEAVSLYMRIVILRAY
jgi:hypothetical protein